MAHGGLTLPGIPEYKTGSSVTSAATGAQQKASVSDQVIQQVLSSLGSGVGMPEGAIQNRPAIMLPPAIHPKQIQMTGPSTNVRATTAAGQQRNDLNSLIHGVSNVVAAGVNAKRQKEDRDLTADLSIIQAAASNPNDPHNQQLIQAIAQDPKKVKRLQKALGYNPFSGEPPPPETQSLMKFHQISQNQKAAKAQQIQQAIASKLGPNAAQMDKRLAVPGQNKPSPIPMAIPGQNTPEPIPNAQIPAGSAISNLLSRMPNVPQMSPAVQLQAQLIKAGVLPKADTSLQSMTTLLKEIMTNDAKYAEIAGRLKEHDIDAANKLESIRERGRQLMNIQKVRDTSSEKRTERRAQATEYSARVRSEATVKASENRMKAIAERTKITQQHKLLQKETHEIDQDIKNLDVQIAAAAKDKQRQQTLIQEQQMKKELKNAKEQLMDVLDKQGAQLDGQIKQSPTSLLNEPDTQSQDDLSQEMDKEDRIF